MQVSPKVDLYIAQQPEHLQPLFEACRQVLLAAPKVQEDLKWKIPFYSYHGLLGYLNPQKDHLLWGFCQGARLSDEWNVFQGHDRKLIRHIKIAHIEDVYKEEVLFTLQEALLWNERSKVGTFKGLG